MDDSLRSAPIGVLEVDSDGTVAAVNDAAATLLDVDPSLDGASFAETFPRSASRSLHAAFDGGVPRERSVEEYYPPIDRWLAVDVVPDGDRAYVYVRDRDPRHDRRQRVEELERRLERLEAIDAVVGDVLRAVITASGHREVSRTVCEGLGTAELYEFAWLGERDPAGGGLRVVAAAGDAPELRERIDNHLGSDDALPEQVAVAEESTRTVQTLADDDAVPREVRLAAFGRGLQSAIAVPLSYRETVYGVLGVYAAREDGFSEAERSSLETLGAIAGFAINASRQEDLLFSDTVTELTVEVRDDEAPLVSVAERCRETLTLAGTVPREDGTVVCYVRADGGDAEAAVAAATDHGAVVGARPIDGDGALLEVELAADTPVATLAGQGATVGAAEFGPDRARVTVEVPAETELRRLVGSLDGVVAETEVLAKTEAERDPTSVDSFRNDLDAALTDRQRQVLRTAYLSDYFTSPRGSSAEDIAAALDVTGPTVLYHLRRAQRKLLESYFGDDARTPAGDDQ